MSGTVRFTCFLNAPVLIVVFLLIVAGCGSFRGERGDEDDFDSEANDDDSASSSDEDDDTTLVGLFAPLKVHVLSADLPLLDAASIYTESELSEFIDGCNTIFKPTGVSWEVVEVTIQPALDEGLVVQAVDTGVPAGGVALAANVDLSALLAPTGWDAIVVAQTSPLGFGGAYKCSLAPGVDAPGAIFVPLRSGNGSPHQIRKWAHELGHMMSLPHTPCEPAYEDNLMMSSGCEFADLHRVGLTTEQIAAVQAQHAIGGPVACGG